MKRFKFYNRKSYFKHFWESKWSLIIIILIFIITAYSTFKVTIHKKEVGQEIKLLELKANQIERENLDLENLIQYLGSYDFIERESRLKLGLQKPGEEVVVILDNQTGLDQSESIKPKEEQKANYLKWWQYFFN